MAVVASALARSLWWGAAVVGGGLLIGISFLSISSSVDQIASRRRLAFAVLKLAGRYALLAFLAYVMIARLRLPPLGLMAGASSVWRRLRWRPSRASPGRRTLKTDGMQEHPLWIVEAVNAVLGQPVAALLGALGFHVEGHEVIPPYIVMTMLIVAVDDGAVPDHEVAAERREPGQVPDPARGRRARACAGCSTSGSGRRGSSTCRSSRRSASSS